MAAAPVIRWHDQCRSTGCLRRQAAGRGPARSRRIEAQRETVLALHEARRDLTLDELRRERGAIEAADARLMLLPPYSPDFNPIEKAFALLEAMLRRAGERTVSALWSLIDRFVDLFQLQECANYFSSCGYDPD